VLPNQLDADKSEKIAAIINENRVWPVGFRGITKRARFIMRLKVRTGAFDSSMTFLVLLNTVTLALQSYNMDPEFSDSLDFYNLIFTWIFLYEFASKHLAFGIVKYWSDKMNYIDGGVVLLSIFEMIINEVLAGDGADLSAFKTIRTLRTMRVFRIGRLLRALESMQTII
jgi:hypothetical protein